MVYTEVMKPRKGQFKFNGPLQITHSKLTEPSVLGDTKITASKFGKEVGHMGLHREDSRLTFADGATSLSGVTGSKKFREVAMVRVNKGQRRKGVATAMWRYAKDNDLKPEHSAAQTDAGKSWAKKVGD